MKANNLIKNAGIVSAGNFSRLLAKSVLSFVLARILSKNDNGSYRQLLLIYNTFAVFFLLGLPNSILYFLPQKKEIEEKKQFISQTFFVIAFLGLILSLLILFFKEFISVKWNNPQLIKLLNIFWIFPFLMFFGESYNYFMLALKKAKKIAWFSLFSIISDILLILSFAFYFKTVYYVTLGLLISVFLQSLYVIFNLKGYLKFTKLDYKSIKIQLYYSFPIWISAFIAFFAKQYDKIIISSFFAPAIYAVFSIGATEIPLVGNIRNSIFSVILPELASYNFEKEKEKIYKLYKGAIRKIALIFFPLTTFFFLFGIDFITVLFSSKYQNSFPIFRIYLTILPLRIANYTIILQIANKTKILMYKSFFILIINILTNILFIYLFGLYGPALATVIVTYLDVLLLFFIFRYFLKLNLKKLFPFLDLIKTFIVAFICAILVFPITFWNNIGLIRLISAFIIFSFLFFFIGKKFNVIKKYDSNLINLAIKKILRK